MKVKPKKLLLLGSTGKMGLALDRELRGKYDIIRVNSKNFDVRNVIQLEMQMEAHKPDIVVNTVAFMGIDQCEQDPLTAFELNMLHPKRLAALSNKFDFLLVHFSSDAVFSDRENGYYTEEDIPSPLNVYGMTKFGGDMLVQAIAKKYYVVRVSVLFGESRGSAQFVEKMLDKIKNGAQSLSIATDIVTSPSYSRDIAQGVQKMLEGSDPYGLYHLANEGKASLHELITEMIAELGLDVEIVEASYKDFPAIGTKNTCTPITSCKIRSLRPRRDAVKDYCRSSAFNA